MNLDFLDRLVISQATIPPVVSRIAGFFLLMQAVLIVFQKKNDPHKAIWEDIQGVLLAGLVVFLFPEFIQFAELLVNSTARITANPQSMIADLMQTTLLGEEAVEEESAGGYFFVDGWHVHVVYEWRKCQCRLLHVCQLYSQTVGRYC